MVKFCLKLMKMMENKCDNNLLLNLCMLIVVGLYFFV